MSFATSERIAIKTPSIAWIEETTSAPEPLTDDCVLSRLSGRRGNELIVIRMPRQEPCAANYAGRPSNTDQIEASEGARRGAAQSRA